MTPLLFIKHKNFNARTVDNDVLILSKEYKVRMYEVNTSKGFGFFLALFKEFFWLLVNIYRYKVLFIWFADYHSIFPVFFSKFFNKTCVINVGGYDADEILTGKPSTLKEKLRKLCVKYSLKKAAEIILGCAIVFACTDLTSNVIIQLAYPNLRAKLEHVIPPEESLRNENCESGTVC